MAVLTLEEIKLHLRLEQGAAVEDALISEANEAAQDYAEQYIGRSIPWTDTDGAEVPVPSSVKAAIKLIAGELYENREQRLIGATIVENPTAHNMLHFYRVGMGI